MQTRGGDYQPPPYTDFRLSVLLSKKSTTSTEKGKENQMPWIGHLLLLWAMCRPETLNLNKFTTNLNALQD